MDEMKTTSEIGRPCAILGGVAGIVLSFLIVLLIGLTGFLGILTLVIMAVGIGIVLASICSRSGGDLFGAASAMRLDDPHATDMAETISAKTAELSQKVGSVSESQTVRDTTTAVSEKASQIGRAVREKVEATTASLSGGGKAAGDDETVVERPAESGKPHVAVKPATKPETAKPAAATPAPAEPAPAKPASPPTPEAKVDHTADIEGEDDLQKIKGIGPQAAAALKELGVTRFSQVAGWNEDDIDTMEEKLGGLPGRIRRDDWVGQAKTLKR